MASIHNYSLNDFYRFSKPIVILLLTEKWIALIPLLQWMVLPVFLPMTLECFAIVWNILKCFNKWENFLVMVQSNLKDMLPVILATIGMAIIITVI
jgi:hypothetical protein